MRSAVPTLLEIQTAMWRGLLGNSDATIAATLSDALAPADRLSIYVNTSRTALTNALRLNFPAVQRLVGEDFFAAAADTFIAREPPQTAWLDLYGESFPEFLQCFEPAAVLIYLPDVARLERAVGRALHAVDAEPLEYSQLLDIAPSARGRVCFTPHPSVSLVFCPYPVDVIWRAVLARDDPALAAIDLSAGAVRLLVERRAGEVEVTRMDERQWKFAEALFTGHSLSTALAVADDPDAAAWLAAHLAAGHLSDFALSNTESLVAAEHAQ
jgi:Putative DNA-binding domain